MKRIGLMVLTLVAMSALSGAAASTSQAVVCFKAAVAGTGKWTDTECTVEGSPKEYILIKRQFNHQIGTDIWCGEVTEPGTGNRTDNACSMGTTGNFVRVRDGLVWQIGGVILEKGTQQIKLVLKGKAKLAVPEAGVEIFCKSSTSESSVIEGQSKQGQDKGRITYKGCETSKKECTVAEPITTNQTKSHLAVSESNSEKVLRPVDVFEPEKGKIFVELGLKGVGCGVLAGKAPVDGSVAAEISPETGEAVEGSMTFPAEAITKVNFPEEEATVGLKVGATNLESTFNAAYGAQLEKGEKFGVGGVK